MLATFLCQMCKKTHHVLLYKTFIGQQSCKTKGNEQDYLSSIAPNTEFNPLNIKTVPTICTFLDFWSKSKDDRLICIVFDFGARNKDNRLITFVFDHAVENILVFAPYSFSEAVICLSDINRIHFSLCSLLHKRSGLCSFSVAVLIPQISPQRYCFFRQLHLI